MPKKVATIDGVFSIDRIGTVIALPTEDQWDIDPKELTWFEERIQSEPQTGATILSALSSKDRILPPARYAVDFRDGYEFVVYGDQCLSEDFCFTWQRWHYHKTDQKP